LFCFASSCFSLYFYIITIFYSFIIRFSSDAVSQRKRQGFLLAFWCQIAPEKQIWPKTPKKMPKNWDEIPKKIYIKKKYLDENCQIVDEN